MFSHLRTGEIAMGIEWCFVWRGRFTVRKFRYCAITERCSCGKANVTSYWRRWFSTSSASSASSSRSVRPIGTYHGRAYTPASATSVCGRSASRGCYWSATLGSSRIMDVGGFLLRSCTTSDSGWCHVRIVKVCCYQIRLSVKPRTHDQQMLVNMCLPTVLANKSLSCVQKVGQHFMLANNVCHLRTCSFFVGQQAVNRAPWLVGCSKQHGGRMDGCILRWLH